jgi:hypothetical protein
MFISWSEEEEEEEEEGEKTKKKKSLAFLSSDKRQRCVFKHDVNLEICCFVAYKHTIAEKN